MEERILGAAQYFYIHIEKRSLPLEASKALTNFHVGKGPKNIALSMLERTKKHLSLWLEDSSQIQIYKRYFGYIAKEETLTLAECFSPFVLINSWESFYEVLISDKERRKQAFGWLKSFFKGMNVEGVLEEKDPEELLRRLIEIVDLPENQKFYIATHLGYMINPHIFIPITKSTGEALSLNEPGSYFRLIEATRKKRIKPIEAYAFLHLLYERVPSKRVGTEHLLGIDREFELLKVAERLWGEERFYEAHEVLEEVWELVKEPEKKECYQGVIRFAIALHHYQSGEEKRAENVLRKAIPQLERCKVPIPINVRELSLQANDFLHKLKEGKPLKAYPTFRVV